MREQHQIRGSEDLLSNSTTCDSSSTQAKKKLDRGTAAKNKEKSEQMSVGGKHIEIQQKRNGVINSVTEESVSDVSVGIGSCWIPFNKKRIHWLPAEISKFNLNHRS